MLCASLLCAAGAAHGGVLRALAIDRAACWAAGDNGTILRSDDAGLTWIPLQPPTRASFQAIQAALGQVVLYGGQAVPGHPDGQGSAVILRTLDGGRTFLPVRAGGASWLYGGCFAGNTALAWGQANWACPGGLLRTIDGGKLWGPASITSTGYLRDGAFHSPRYGWLVGAGGRLVPLRELAEPRIAPPAPQAGADLRAARFAEERTCWAVGDNGTVLRSGPPGRAWDPVAPPLPPGARRCADFEALAFAGPQQAWVAGGLIGLVARTDNAGARWQLSSAPGPGAVHALAAGADGLLLACGDGERIWRSADGGGSWQRVHGRDGTDVLFVVAAGDRSVYPAIVAHALAGSSVAVVYATHLGARPDTPPDQPLRAAAARAGADGIATLTEFASVAGDPAAEDADEAEIVRRWSLALDAPAEPEMLRQLAAAIRLYRPAVLAVGPDGTDAAAPARGRLAENRLISRLARRAAEMAARDDALDDLAAAGLAPWRVGRVFVGLAGNEQWQPPWQPATGADRRKAAVSFDAADFPGDDRLPLGLLAAEAVWLLPGTGLLDRPGSPNAYRCEGLARPVRLFTTGVADGRLTFSPGNAAQRDLATCASLGMAISRGQTYRAADDVIGMMKQAGSPESAALAADRLLLCWRQLLAEGKLIEADHALAAFGAHGGPHPLSERLAAVALAAAVSAEWRAQVRAHGLPADRKVEHTQAAVAAFSRRPAWALAPEGLMLYAKALAGMGFAPPAARALRQLSREPYPIEWRRCALLELASAETTEEALRGRRRATAKFIAERGRFDGRLDEACWKAAPVLDLRPAERGGTPRDPDAETASPPAVQVVRSVGGFVILGVRLPRAVGRHWRLDVAIDADRDAWTQLVLHWDTRGGHSAGLSVRYGPTAALPPGAFAVQAGKDEQAVTLELALPIKALTDRPPVTDIWYFQLRATAEDLITRTTYYFQPQGDGRLLPERYGLLRVPGETGEPSTRPAK